MASFNHLGPQCAVTAPTPAASTAVSIYSGQPRQQQQPLHRLCMYYYGGLESVQDLNIISGILIWSNPQKKSAK